MILFGKLECQETLYFAKQFISQKSRVAYRLKRGATSESGRKLCPTNLAIRPPIRRAHGAIKAGLRRLLPAKVGKRLVCLGHTVSICLFLNGVAGVIKSVHNFRREFFRKTMILFIRPVIGGFH